MTPMEWFPMSDSKPWLSDAEPAPISRVLSDDVDYLKSETSKASFGVPPSSAKV